MNKVTNVVMKSLDKSIYLKPYTMHFTQNGQKKTWDLLGIHDSVAVILFNVSRNVLVLVKQFRPAVYLGTIDLNDRKIDSLIDTTKYPPENGITIELCAGIVDKNLTLPEIAKEEVLEECGYDVPVSAMQLIGSYRSGVGTSASIQTAYYCEVTDDMRVSKGGGTEDELIEVVEMTLDEVKKYVTQTAIVNSPPSFLFGIYWFLLHKSPKT
ncbi:uridine diphosphate glucose pyrophosphatase NUDT14-like [Euwallacea fornicatus]|uniref:uridine diphosphate glucose pyrophosphatase NUDT14-like n=1 Tax=Euwallacea fornicatus TaxID=995702 RepID=UPI00338EE427